MMLCERWVIDARLLEGVWSKTPRKKLLNCHLDIVAVCFGHVHIPIDPKLDMKTVKESVSIELCGIWACQLPVFGGYMGGSLARGLSLFVRPLLLYPSCPLSTCLNLSASLSLSLSVSLSLSLPSLSPLSLSLSLSLSLTHTHMLSLSLSLRM